MQSNLLEILEKEKAYDLDIIKEIRDFLKERFMDNTILSNYSTDYKHYQEQASETFYQLKNVLNENNKEILFNYESETSSLEAIALDIGYERGFKEAFELFGILNK